LGSLGAVRSRGSVTFEGVGKRGGMTSKMWNTQPWESEKWAVVLERGGWGEWDKKDTVVPNCENQISTWKNKKRLSGQVEFEVQSLAMEKDL